MCWFTEIKRCNTQNTALNYVRATDVPYVQTSIVHRNGNTWCPEHSRSARSWRSLRTRLKAVRESDDKRP